MKKIKDRIKATSNVPDIYRAERPPFPKNIKIEITSRCDLKCYFCSVTYKDRKKGHIDKDLMLRLIKESAALGVTDLGLFWLGEPLLVPELPEYIAYAKEVGIPYVFITTNGRLANEKNMRPIIEAGIDSIKFSLNASNRKKYAEVTAVDAFDRVLENIKTTFELRQGKPRPALYASTVYDPDEVAEFEKTVELIKKFVDQHYSLRRYGEQTSEDEGARDLSSMLPCWSLFTEPHISYDGHMSACFCDHDPKYFMGDLKQMSLLEAWHSDRFVELRKKHLQGDVSGSVCESCIAYKN